MRTPLVGFVLLAALAAAGCASGGGGNPNLLAPKLVVQARPDGNVTLFVHGAFREQTYDRISLAVDNQSVANRTLAFSVETTVPSGGFFTDVQAQSGTQLYEARARIDLDAAGDRVRVAFDNADGWAEPRTYTLPFEHVLDHPKVAS